MIRLVKGAKPAVLETNEAAWTAVYVEHRANGTRISNTDKSRHRHPEIKSALRSETHDKCAYCEAKITHTYPGDCEHILPKSKRPDLFVAWDNLTLCCGECNHSKGDYYVPEEPLVNPYTDDPLEHLQFLGPMVFAMPGSAKGRLTEAMVDLSRTALIERRADRLKLVKAMSEEWRAAPGPGLKEALKQRLESLASPPAEFSAAVRAFLTDHLGW